MAKHPLDCDNCGKNTYYVYKNPRTGEVKAFCQKPDCQQLLQDHNLASLTGSPFAHGPFTLIDEW